MFEPRMMSGSAIGAACIARSNPQSSGDIDHATRRPNLSLKRIGACFAVQVLFQ